MKNKILLSILFIANFLFLGFPVFAKSLQLQGGDFRTIQGQVLQPAQTTYYSPIVVDSTLTVNKAGYFPSGIHVGKTSGEGGVTYFNGTIVNASAGDKPVTIADDLRVDGKIIRYNKGELAPVQIKSGLFLQGSIYGYKDLITFDDNVKINPKKKLVVKDVTIEGLSINNSQIANDAITTEKIKDGTIVGSDISSSADLDISNLGLSGNASQSYDKSGLIKAIAYVNSSGGIVRSWNPLSQEAISLAEEHTSDSGIYKLNFHWNVSGRYFQVTPVNDRNINITAKFGGTSHLINIYTWGSDGAATDSGFMITVY